VHLDFSRGSVRARQVASMLDVLSKRSGPRIVMGDFNAERHEDSAVKMLGERLDWILASGDLEVVEQRVLPTAVSDHLAVVATVRVRAPESVRAVHQSAQCSLAAYSAASD
jgi:endonuclease/exonuclease/phosphatase family metal-dependent hydrolase